MNRQSSNVEDMFKLIGYKVGMLEIPCCLRLHFVKISHEKLPNLTPRLTPVTSSLKFILFSSISFGKNCPAHLIFIMSFFIYFPPILFKELIYSIKIPLSPVKPMTPTLFYNHLSLRKLLDCFTVVKHFVTLLY